MILCYDFIFYSWVMKVIAGNLNKSDSRFSRLGG